MCLLGIVEIIIFLFSFFFKGKKNYFFWPEMFCSKDVLKTFSKFTGKHLCQSLFFNKAANWYTWRKPFVTTVLSVLNNLKGDKLIANNKYIDKWIHVVISWSSVFQARASTLASWATGNITNIFIRYFCQEHLQNRLKCSIL